GRRCQQGRDEEDRCPLPQRASRVCAPFLSSNWTPGRRILVHYCDAGSVTLSKVAVTRAELSLALTARPMYTFCAMLMVRLDPTCAQFTPSDDAYPLNVLPLRTSFTQYGNPLTALLCDAVVPPVLARE